MRKGGEHMRKRVAILLAVLLLVSVVPVMQQTSAEETTVRVRLSTSGASAVTVAVKGSYSVNGTSFTGGTVTASISDGTINVKHSEKGTLASDGTSVRLVRADAPYDNAYLTLDNTSHGECTYLGDFVFYNNGGTLRVINHVGMHEYLYGAVSGEVSESSHVELLKTQTICAKGFALAEVEARGKEYFDVYDTTTSQIYVGYVATDVRTIAAVDAVWQNTLRYNGNTVKTYYCTANGGQAITPRIRWGGSGNAGAYSFRYDPFDLLGSSKNVTITINGKDPESMPDALYAYFLGLATDEVSGTATDILSVDAVTGVYDSDHPNGTDRYPSALAPQEQCSITMTVARKGSSNATATCDFTLQNLVSKGLITASGTNCFVVRTAESEWKLIYGNASGHRAGLSHRGAIQMAKAGYSYVDILKFYYGGAQLEQPNGTVIPSTASFAFTYEEGATGGTTTATPKPTEPTVTSTPTPTPTAVPVTPLPDTEGHVIVIGDEVNFRSAATTSSASLGKLALGTILAVVSEEDEWHRVIWEERAGYVHNDYVSYYEVNPTLHWDGVCNYKDTNYRSGPHTNFSSIDKLAKGEKLGIYYRSGNWYYAVVWETGLHGWIYYKYVDLLSDYTPRYTIGDLNGDGRIAADDATILLRHVVGQQTMPEEQLACADVNGDGTINAADATVILRYVVGITGTLQ